MPTFATVHDPFCASSDGPRKMDFSATMPAKQIFCVVYKNAGKADLGKGYCNMKASIWEKCHLLLCISALFTVFVA